MRTVWSLCGGLALCIGLGVVAAARPQEDRVSVLRARVLGLDLFVEHCASCHGRTAHGNGPRTGELRAKASDLTRLSERNGWIYPRDGVRRVIEGADPAHRSREMPLWGDVFSASAGPDGPDARTRIDALVHYLEFVQYRPRR
jgi:mono/diheme cytochrome c family protein